MFYICEIQTNKDGTGAHIMFTAPTLNEAESKYHQILSYAAVSTLPCHAAIIFDEKGYTQMSRFYEHAQGANDADN